ncbi:hyaluronoglucosaminidase [Streptomyces sp. enrichment culture]|uniref:hyaluronoglucosaminidase n=1 Tax=Streptomyces sp. enrichment culture TaxID=1795815 RepID=UPI003F555D0B
MGVTRRLFLGGFTAGAVTVAAGGEAVAAETAEAAGEPTTFDGPVVAQRFVADTTTNGAFLKTTSTTDHALTVYQGGKSGTGVALNVISDNPDDSAVYIKGHERAQRGTVKITHVGAPDGSDAGASALSIDLTVAGTAAQGIHLIAGNGPTKGNLICLRNNGRDDFVVKGSGRVGVGMDIGANPWSQLHVVQRPGTDSALMVEGLVRLVNVAAAPTGVDSRGGGVLYARNGELWWRGPNGDPSRIAPA